MPVEIIEHTADIRLRVYGRSFPLALLELSNYMLNIIFKGDIECDILLSSFIKFNDYQSCVVHFLSDVLYHQDSLNLAMKVRFLKIYDDKIMWEGCGQKFNASKHEGRYLIKAVTYDRLIVDMEKNLIEITFDI